MHHAQRIINCIGEYINPNHNETSRLVYYINDTKYYAGFIKICKFNSVIEVSLLKVAIIYVDK